MHRSHPIGIFDSGFGGLTVFKEIIKELPQYDYIYLGDNARAPYGPRSFEVIYKYTLEAVKKLFEMDCWLIILACNTASAKALRSIQQRDLPKIDPHRRVLGVLRSSVEVIGSCAGSGHIGVFGTEGTVSSESYPLEIKKLFPGVHVVQEACPMWVSLVENNEHESDGADFFVKKNIGNLLKKDSQIDVIILGCTHYPFLLSKIKKYLPAQIQIISQDKIVAESLKNYLYRHPEIEEKCSQSGLRTFYTTGSSEIFESRSSLFLGYPVKASWIEIT